MDLPLLSTAYLPPIEYVALIAKSGGCVIEKHEHFIKQTYRNRAVIATGNGPLALIIPLKKGKNN
jgi:WbqC-like protein family